MELSPVHESFSEANEIYIFIQMTFYKTNSSQPSLPFLCFSSAVPFLGENAYSDFSALCDSLYSLHVHSISVLSI